MASFTYSSTGIIGLSFLLSACMVGPDYQKPETVLPNAWISAPDKPNQNHLTIDQAWWKNFHDPVLNQLITKAATNNFDVKIAETRITQARASQEAATAALFPVGEMIANANRQSNQIGFPSSAPSTLTGALKKPFNIFKTGFDASWELDLFGGHRREAESAKAELEASALSRDDLVISLLAEVAATYIEIRQYQAQLSLAQQTIDADVKTTTITQQRVELGESAGVDIARVESQLQRDQAQIPYVSNQLSQAEYRMDVLLGEKPGATHSLVNPIKALPSMDQKLLLAAPASVIAQRPDIRSAERKLASATAQEGVATAKFFPDVSLVGFIGLFNTNAGNLLNVSSKSWSMGANVLWPILSFGSLSANLSGAEARQQEALTKYQKALINALSDVESSVIAYTEQEKYNQSVEKATAADQNIYGIAVKRYEEGLASYLDVLDVQRKLYSSQNQLTLAKAQTAHTLIAVYKSLGGGWKPVNK